MYHPYLESATALSDKYREKASKSKNENLKKYMTTSYDVK